MSEAAQYQQNHTTGTDEHDALRQSGERAKDNLKQTWRKGSLDEAAEDVCDASSASINFRGEHNLALNSDHDQNVVGGEWKFCRFCF